MPEFGQKFKPHSEAMTTLKQIALSSSNNHEFLKIVAARHLWFKVPITLEETLTRLSVVSNDAEVIKTATSLLTDALIEFKIPEVYPRDKNEISFVWKEGAMLMIVSSDHIHMISFDNGHLLTNVEYIQYISGALPPYVTNGIPKK